MSTESAINYCLRHPDVETNLRCGRCGDLICPRCMVQSPVGGRCPDCAAIGRAPMFVTTGVDYGKATTAAMVSGAVTALGIVGAIWLLVVPISFTLGYVPVAILQVVVGIFVGESVRRATGYKVSRPLQYIAGGGAFFSYAIAIALLAITPSLHPALITNFVNLIAMAVSVYIAMQRVRP